MFSLLAIDGQRMFKNKNTKTHGLGILFKDYKKNRLYTFHLYYLICWKMIDVDTFYLCYMYMLERE